MTGGGGGCVVRGGDVCGCMVLCGGCGGVVGVVGVVWVCCGGVCGVCVCVCVLCVCLYRVCVCRVCVVCRLLHTSLITRDCTIPLLPSPA